LFLIILLAAVKSITTMWSPHSPLIHPQTLIAPRVKASREHPYGFITWPRPWCLILGRKVIREAVSPKALRAMRAAEEWYLIPAAAAAPMGEQGEKAETLVVANLS